MATDELKTTKRYIIATKRDRRDIARTAAEVARSAGLVVRDYTNPHLILIESPDDIGTLRAKVGSDHFVEPEIFYEMMQNG